MQVTETLKDGLKRGYTIRVTAAEFAAKVDAKLAEAQPRIELKGFRKGKAPMALLRKQMGPRVMGEAMQEAIDAAMAEHFRTSGDRPSMQPSMQMANESWKEGDDIEVSMTYEALPEVPEIDFAQIRLERLLVKADESSVTSALEKLAEGAPSFERRGEDDAAEEGDQVIVDFVGRIGSEEFEGGTAHDYPIVLGGGRFIPGFEEQLKGVKAGETRDVSVTFPEAYVVKDLSGKDAVFTVTVKSVGKPKPTDLDDALATRYGVTDIAELREQVSSRLESEYQGAARAVMKRALLDQLDTMVSFELPSNLVEAEASQIAHQLWHEEHHEHQGHDHGEIAATDEHRTLAVRRVRLGLLLAEIGRKHDVKITEQEMTAAVVAQARQYPGQERAFIEYVQQNPAVRQQIQAPIFEDKVVDLIFAQAQVTDREVGREDLQKAVDALDEA